MGNRKVRLGQIDKEILMILYRFLWVYDYHVAALIGENQSYVKGRLKQLAQAGLVGRKILLGNQPAANWITKTGMQELGVEPRKVHEPRPKTCEHDRACSDIYTALAISTAVRDGKCIRLRDLNSVVTERDLLAARKTVATGYQTKSGKMIYKPVDLAHRPDGYLITKLGQYIAIESELTPKSKKKKLFDNIDSNFLFFTAQWWFTDKESIKNAILSHANEMGMSDRVKVFSLTKVHDQLLRYVHSQPETISKKDLRQRISAVLSCVPTVIPTEELPQQMIPESENRNTDRQTAMPQRHVKLEE